MNDLSDFYAELDASIPDEQTMICNGRRVILSSEAYSKPFEPETHDEWLARLKRMVQAGLELDKLPSWQNQHLPIIKITMAELRDLYPRSENT